MPGGQINDPFLGECFSFPFLPVTPLSLALTLEGPSTGLVRCFRSYIQRNKDTVRCAVLSAQVTGHRQKTADATLCLLKSHFLTPFLDCEKSTAQHRAIDQTCQNCRCRLCLTHCGSDFVARLRVPRDQALLVSRDCRSGETR